MPADLRVDLDALADAAAGLDSLRSEFDQASQIADDARSALGHPTVKSALDTFVNNWDKHRQDLSKSLEAVAGMARNSHDAYVETDTGLATNLTSAADAR